MTNITPEQDFLLTFPEDENGEPVTQYRFMLTLGKPIKEVHAALQSALGTLDGVDGFNVRGTYTLEIAIARTFEASIVIEELERRLKEDVLSDIVRPNNKIIT